MNTPRPRRRRGSRLAGWSDSSGWSGWFHQVPVPGTAKEYFTTAPGLTWLGVLGTDTGSEDAVPVSYPLGRTTAEHWNKAPIGAAGSFVRCGDSGMPMLSPFSSPTGAHHSEWWGDTTATVTLAKNGSVLATTDDFRYGQLPDMVEDKADYALRLQAQRNDPGAQLGTAIDATWTFSSARPADGGCTTGSAPLPLVRVDADLDLANAAPADRPLVMTAAVTRPDGTTPRVKDFRIEASFDDGKHWLSLPVLPTGDGTYKIVAPPPGPFGTGYVALRTTVRDADGNGLKQTVARAFRVAGR